MAICAGRDTFRVRTLRVLLTAFAAGEGLFFGHRRGRRGRRAHRIEGAISLYLDLANLVMDFLRIFDWLSS